VCSAGGSTCAAPQQLCCWDLAEWAGHWPGNATHVHMWPCAGLVAMCTSLSGCWAGSALEPLPQYQRSGLVLGAHAQSPGLHCGLALIRCTPAMPSVCLGVCCHSHLGGGCHRPRLPYIVWWHPLPGLCSIVGSKMGGSNRIQPMCHPLVLCHCTAAQLQAASCGRGTACLVCRAWPKP
jgi:hypothetical protein